MYFNMNGTNKGVDYGLVTLDIQGPPLMPPGLNSNGRTPPGRHGVAAPPPGSQMFAHMRSLNNSTLAPWVPTAGPMASLVRDQMAPPPVCQVGFVVATREMPHGRRTGGRVWECGQSMLPTRERANKRTFQSPPPLRTHFPYPQSLSLLTQWTLKLLPNKHIFEHRCATAPPQRGSIRR